MHCSPLCSWRAVRHHKGYRTGAEGNALCLDNLACREGTYSARVLPAAYNLLPQSQHEHQGLPRRCTSSRTRLLHFASPPYRHSRIRAKIAQRTRCAYASWRRVPLVTRNTLRSYACYLCGWCAQTTAALVPPLFACIVAEGKCRLRCTAYLRLAVRGSRTRPDAHLAAPLRDAALKRT